ncbi:MAG TPA: alpha/beta hydrolase [Stellaceae bacterium]|nr:alpha/beta hydrolase [Stellaceae bacterium]
MATLETEGITLYYETHGDRANPPVMLIAGLGGTGASWSAQVARFARHYFVVLPDHRGTGRTTRAKGGYTIEQHAADMAGLLRHLDLGPTHIVGSSTGGAIAQVLALDYAPLTRGIVMSSAFARMDSFMRREFTLRRKLLAESDPHTIFSAYALFLFSPRYTDRHPDHVAAWIERAASASGDRDIALMRADMVMTYDGEARLGGIRKPVLLICGDNDFCTPLHVSEQIAAAIPGAELAVIRGGGHFTHDEEPDLYFERVRSFLDSH